MVLHKLYTIYNFEAQSFNLLVALDSYNINSSSSSFVSPLIMNGFLTLSGMSKDDAMTAYITLGKEVIAKYGM